MTYTGWFRGKVNNTRSSYTSCKVICRWGLDFRIFILYCNKCRLNITLQLNKINSKLSLLFVTIHHAVICADSNNFIWVTFGIRYTFTWTLLFSLWSIISPLKMLTFSPESPCMNVIIYYYYYYLFSLALHPSVGYGLLVHEVSWSHVTTRHSR
jgi:hypothetical protein